LNLEQPYAQTNFYQGKTIRIIVGYRPEEVSAALKRILSQ
jgi:hypothetical protein